MWGGKEVDLKRDEVSTDRVCYNLFPLLVCHLFSLLKEDLPINTWSNRYPLVQLLCCTKLKILVCFMVFVFRQFWSNLFIQMFALKVICNTESFNDYSHSNVLNCIGIYHAALPHSTLPNIITNRSWKVLKL